MDPTPSRGMRVYTLNCFSLLILRESAGTTFSIGMRTSIEWRGPNKYCQSLVVVAAHRGGQSLHHVRGATGGTPYTRCSVGYANH